MHILLVGASGKTGTEIMKQALAEKYTVTAAVRNPSKISISNAQLNIVQADVSKIETFKAVFETQAFDHIIIALGNNSLGKTTLRSEGTKTVISALKQSGKSARIWVISTVGVGNSKKQLPFALRISMLLILRNVIKDHERQESLVISSGFSYTIVRPAGLTNLPATGSYTSISQGKLPSGQITRADVAHYIIRNLEMKANLITSISKK
jgi:putative NADH-flavin reductase